MHLRAESSDNSDSEEEDEVGEFPGRREIVAFLQWIVFCDKVLDPQCLQSELVYLQFPVLIFLYGKCFIVCLSCLDVLLLG